MPRVNASVGAVAAYDILRKIMRELARDWPIFAEFANLHYVHRRDVGSSYSEDRGREICSVAKLVYGLSQSLDGYVDHMKLGPPAPAVFHHFIELMRGLTGVIHGRHMYEIMRY